MGCKKLFRGITPAMYTCYNDDGTVNLEETVSLARWLVEKGAGGFYLCGTTGNGLLLSRDERKAIVEAISGDLGGQVPLMIHVGAMNTADSIELARHGAKLKGVCAISSLPPQFYPMPFVDEIAHLSKIAAATDLGFYPYLFPGLIGQHGIAAIIEGFAKIPNMAGIKAFVADLSVHQSMMRFAPAHWELLHGNDHLLAFALTIAGVDGAIGSTYNAVPEIAVAIFNAAQAGEYAEAFALHKHFGGYLLSVDGNPFLPFGRYFLQKRGFKMGPPRSPLLAPTGEAIAVVEKKMEDVGFDPLVGGMISDN